MNRLRILSYNIHKGFSMGNRRFVLNEIRGGIREINPDVVCLQEVSGENHHFRKKVKEYPLATQFEFLADEMWPHFAYGKNSVYQRGHHGNAILSRYPIESSDNFDMSTNALEQRGLLHAVIDGPGIAKVHMLTTHLNLLERGRRIQTQKICDYIRGAIPADERIIFSGDFNDWREGVSLTLNRQLGMEEAFMKLYSNHAKTYPSFFPRLRLDRLYFRNVEPVGALVLNGGHWRNLSDHLPICADFAL